LVGDRVRPTNRYLQEDDMKVAKNTQRRNQSGVARFWVLSLAVCISLVPSAGDGKTAGEVLKAYEGLTGKQREQKLIEGAKREGTMVEYGITASDSYKRVLEEFNKKYPFITTRYQRAGAVDTYNKIVNEARAKAFNADIISLNPGQAYTIFKDGLLDPYLSPSRQGIKKEFLDKDGYWTTLHHQVVVLGYNTNKVKKEEIPKRYDDVLDPRWKGRTIMDDEDMDLMGTIVEYWGKDKGIAYFKKLAQNEPSIRRGHSFAAQLLSSGETDMVPWLFGYRVLELMRKGAPLEFVLLKPVLTLPTHVMLAKNAPHPHSAALFMDWALSRDGAMKIFAEEFGIPTARSGYRTKSPELEVPEYLAVDPLKIGPNFAEYTKLYCSILKFC
jgi:iron(III) transport system substrate-binding protein